jgi:hypothetical protein
LINGVVHAAGVVETTPIQSKSSEEVKAIWRAKILGTLVLEKAFADQRLDLLILFSSVASLEGKAGGVASSAANAFLDAYALCQASRFGRRTVSVNWDAWSEIGMAVSTKRSGTFAESNEFLTRGIGTKEGIDAFFSVAASGRPQVVVTHRDPTCIFDRPEVPVYSQQVAPPAFAPLPAENAGRNATNKNARLKYSRPALSEEYVAPHTSVELAIAVIWEEVLRVEPIGVNDDFFELGGHSILALQMLPRVRTKFQVELLLRDVWAAPTIAEMALLVEAKLTGMFKKVDGTEKQHNIDA